MPLEKNFRQSDSAVPPGESFADVARACHRWLMERDPNYARDYAHNSRRMQAIADRRKDKS